MHVCSKSFRGCYRKACSSFGLTLDVLAGLEIQAWPGEETKRTKKRTKKLPGEGWGDVLTGLVCAVGFRVLMLCLLGVLLVRLVVVVVVVADEFVRFR